MDYKNNNKLTSYALGIMKKHRLGAGAMKRVKFQWASRRMTNTFGTANYQTFVVKV